jgi:hypothetical protein
MMSGITCLRSGGSSIDNVTSATTPSTRLASGPAKREQTPLTVGGAGRPAHVSPYRDFYIFAKLRGLWSSLVTNLPRQSSPSHAWVTAILPTPCRIFICFRVDLAFRERYHVIVRQPPVVSPVLSRLSYCVSHIEISTGNRTRTLGRRREEHYFDLRV